MGRDPVVEHGSDIRLTAVSVGSRGGIDDHRRNTVEYGKGLDDRACVIAIVFCCKGDGYFPAERSDDGRGRGIIREGHEPASVVRCAEISPLRIEPCGVLGHGSRAGGHSVLEVVGDDWRDIVRQDGDGLGVHGGIAAIVIGYPFAQYRAASAECGIIGLGVGDGQGWVNVGAVVRGFDIGDRGKVGNTIDRHIRGQGNRVEDRRKEVDKNDGESKQGGISEIIDGLVEHGDGGTTHDRIADFIPAADGVDGERDDDASRDVRDHRRRTRCAPVERSHAGWPGIDLVGAAIGEGKAAALPETHPVYA